MCSSPVVLTGEVGPSAVGSGPPGGQGRDPREVRAALPGLEGVLVPRVQVEQLLTLVLVAHVDGVVVLLLGLGRQRPESPGHMLLGHSGSSTSPAAPHLGPGRQDTSQGPAAPTWTHVGLGKARLGLTLPP